MKISLRLIAITSLITLFSSLSNAATFDVDIAGFKFTPESLVIQVGDTVRWTNNDGAPHTATSDTLVWDSGNLTTGQQYEFKFLKPGTYSYHCDVHPTTMKDAKIFVEGTLGTDTDVVPETTGGVVNFGLEAGVANMNRNYILLGSVAGVSPGFTLPGGLAVMPLNWDLFTSFTVDFIKTPLFMNFLGTLDGSGMAAAQMNLPPVPGAAGFSLYFAYALNGPWDFVSNNVQVLIVP